MHNVHPLIFIRALFWETLKSAVSAPLVYYTLGLKYTARAVYQRLVYFERYFALKLSVKTLFTPLYGDYTRSGRVVGFLMRSFLLFSRTIAFLAVAAVLLLFFVLYGIFPLLIAYFLLNANFPLAVLIKIKTIF